MSRFLKTNFKILKNWKETWGSLIILLIPLLYTIEYTKDVIITNIPFHWILSLIFFLWAWIQTNYNFMSKKELENEISSLENANGMLQSSLESIPANMVKIFYKHFQLGNDDRVTVYRVKNNEFFIPVGRFSDQPIYRKNGRQKYPIDSGFIGKCWEEEEVKIHSLPNFTKDNEKYIEVVSEKSNIDKDVLRKLEMKSRCFYCKRLTFNGDVPIAVVVIESCNPNFKVDVSNFKHFLEGPFGKSLVEAIQNNLPVGGEETNNG